MRDRLWRSICRCLPAPNGTLGEKAKRSATQRRVVCDSRSFTKPLAVRPLATERGGIRVASEPLRQQGDATVPVDQPNTLQGLVTPSCQDKSLPAKPLREEHPRRVNPSYARGGSVRIASFCGTGSWAPNAEEVFLIWNPSQAATSRCAEQTRNNVRTIRGEKFPLDDFVFAFSSRRTIFHAGLVLEPATDTSGLWRR